MSRYCEVGPENHDGTHIGGRTKAEYLRRLSVWRNFQKQKRKVTNAASD